MKPPPAAAWRAGKGLGGAALTQRDAPEKTAVAGKERSGTPRSEGKAKRVIDKRG